MTKDELRTKLTDLAEKDYKKFSASLIPGIDNILGIRLPQLRKIAGEIASDNWREVISWNEPMYFEETMIQGMLLGCVKCDIDELFIYVKEFIGRIDNWSVNDSFCNSFKIARKQQQKTWEFLMDYVNSRHEYEIRVVAVMLMDHFLNDEYIDKVLEVLHMLNVEQYYASMGVAWAYATAWAKYPDKTKTFLTEHQIDRDTYLKTLQKCLESYRITDEDKEYIRGERSRIRAK